MTNSFFTNPSDLLNFVNFNLICVVKGFLLTHFGCLRAPLICGKKMTMTRRSSSFSDATKRIRSAAKHYCQYTGRRRAARIIIYSLESDTRSWIIGDSVFPNDQLRTTFRTNDEVHQS